MDKCKKYVSALLLGQRQLQREFFLKCSGASAIEYALIGSLISVAIVVTLGLAGVSLESIYIRIDEAFSG